MYRGIFDDIDDVPYFRQLKGAVPGMKDITVSEALSKKLTLGRDILTMIKTFEEATDLVVDSIELFSGDDDERTAKIEVSVIL